MMKSFFKGRIIYAKILILFLVVSCSGDDESDEITDTPVEITIEGDYFGTSMAGGFNTPVSITVRRTGPDSFNGDFFGTSDGTPCCTTDGSRDGNLSFEVDGDEINNFMVNFNNTIQSCGGVFLGTGTVEEDGSLVLDVFISTNCDGATDTDSVWRLRKRGS